MGYVAQTNVLDYSEGQWRQSSGLPVVRRYATGVTWSNAMVVMGGLPNSGTAVSDVYMGTGYEFGVTPLIGVVTGGLPMTITGSDLGDGFDITNVTVCGAPAVIDSQSATQLLVTTGGGMIPGLGHVKIFSTSLGMTTRSNAFTALTAGAIGLTTPLAASAVYTGSNPDSQLMALTNHGESAYACQAQTLYSDGGSDWLGLSITNGVLGPQTGLTLTATFDMATLGAGTHTATVQVWSADATNSPFESVATLTIAKADQAITFPPISDQITTGTVGLAATSV